MESGLGWFNLAVGMDDGEIPEAEHPAIPSVSTHPTRATCGLCTDLTASVDLELVGPVFKREAPGSFIILQASRGSEEESEAVDPLRTRLAYLVVYRERSQRNESRSDRARGNLSEPMYRTHSRWGDPRGQIARPAAPSGQ